MTTTLAIQIRNAFQIFAEQAKVSGSQQHLSLVECWRRAFKADKEHDEILFEGLALLGAALSRLSDQVSSSKRLDSDSIAVARSTIEGLRRCVLADTFHQTALQFQQDFSSDRLAILGMLAQTLRVENPEAQLSIDDLAKVTELVEQLISVLSEAEIDPGLKSVLMRHASIMMWTVRNIDFAGFQSVYEAMARFLITAQRLPIDNAESTSKYHGDNCKTRLTSVCRSIMSVLNAAENAERAAQGLLQLSQQGAKLFDTIAQTLLPPT